MTKQRKGGASSRLRGHCSCCGTWKNDCPANRVPFRDLKRLGQVRRLPVKRLRLPTVLREW